MKSIIILLILFCGCQNHTTVKPKELAVKDTVLQVDWDIENGDTISGSSIRIINGDTVISCSGCSEGHPEPQIKADL